MRPIHGSMNPNENRVDICAGEECLSVSIEEAVKIRDQINEWMPYTRDAIMLERVNMLVDRRTAERWNRAKTIDEF